MKKHIILLIFPLFLTQITEAQIIKIGLKGGVNTTKLSFVDFNFQTISSNLTLSMDKSELGFHAGVFARLKIAKCFVQPEIYYTNATTMLSVVDPNGGTSQQVTVKYHLFDVPVMVGVKVSAFRFYGGPVISFPVNMKIKYADQSYQELIEEYVGYDEKKWKAQIGVGVDLGDKITLDARYEFHFGDFSSANFGTHLKQHTFVFSLGYCFGD